MELSIIRHGPKNNDPNAHGTGVEALLDPKRIPEITAFAHRYASQLDEKCDIEIITTTIDRSIATGKVIYDSIKPNRSVQYPRIDELLGSASANPQTGRAINLSPKAMSLLWAESKRSDSYGTLQGEHKPLYAWASQGFDNPQAKNPDDLGISLREIACRLGAFSFNVLSNGGKNAERLRSLAIGHSGDIEPFLYLCLEMLDGRDGTNPETMVGYFNMTGGSLEPLTGISFRHQNSDFYLDYAVRQPGNRTFLARRRFGIEILQQQKQWFEEYGKSAVVLEQKLKTT